MSAKTERIESIIAPLAQRLGLSVYDVDMPAGNLRILLDAPNGLDMDVLATASREISTLLDQDDPINGSYTLEVSSPGLERPLRRPDHFVDALGERVKVKIRPGTGGDRRAEGTLSAADDAQITIDDDRVISIDDITKASVVVDWDAEIAKAGRKNANSEGDSADTEPTQQPNEQQNNKNPNNSEKLSPVGETTTKSSEESP